MGGISGDSGTPKADFRTCPTILPEIVVEDSSGEGGCGPSVPPFVSWIIETGQLADSKAVESFLDICAILPWNEFKIMDNIGIEAISNCAKVD
jgi:hypothetical protein